MIQLFIHTNRITSGKPNYIHSLDKWDTYHKADAAYALNKLFLYLFLNSKSQIKEALLDLLTFISKLNDVIKINC